MNVMRRTDPITLEVIWGGLISTCDEMGTTFARAAYSPVIKEGRDFAATVMDPAGNLTAHGTRDLPAHLGTFEFTARSVIEDIGKENMKPGDVFIFNNPYRGGTHNSDMRVVRPVFHNGEIVAFLTVSGHWTDVGGWTPGTFQTKYGESYAEGILVETQKIVDKGELLSTTVKEIMSNIRQPEVSYGDLRGQLEAAATGEKRVLQYVKRYGVKTFHDAIEEIYDHSEASLRSKVMQSMPPGVYEFSDSVEEDFLDPDKRPINVHLKLTVSEKGDLEFDYTKSDPAPHSNVGSSFPFSASAVYIAVHNMFPGIIPSHTHDHGVARALNIKTIPGSSVHILPPSGFSCSLLVHDKVFTTAIGAIGKASPEKKVGCCYFLLNMILSGKDPRFKNRPYIMYTWMIGGYGGSTYKDSNTMTLVPYSTGTANIPIETLERRFPALFEVVEIMQDSPGAGKFRGGPGERRIFSMSSDITFTSLADRAKVGAWGIDGGQPSLPNMMFLNRGSPGERRLNVFDSGVFVKAGDRIEYMSQGGGGYGNPFERDPKAVLADVESELISLGHAREKYGVEVDKKMKGRLAEYSVNWDETARLRAK